MKDSIEGSGDKIHESQIMPDSGTETAKLPPMSETLLATGPSRAELFARESATPEPAPPETTPKLESIFPTMAVQSLIEDAKLDYLDGDDESARKKLLEARLAALGLKNQLDSNYWYGAAMRAESMFEKTHFKVGPETQAEPETGPKREPVLSEEEQRALREVVDDLNSRPAKQPETTAPEQNQNSLEEPTFIRRDVAGESPEGKFSKIWGGVKGMFGGAKEEIGEVAKAKWPEKIWAEDFIKQRQSEEWENNGPASLVGDTLVGKLDNLQEVWPKKTWAEDYIGKREPAGVVEREIEKMPAEERTKVGWELRNLGYSVEELKNNKFAEIFGKIEKKLTESGKSADLIKTLSLFRQDAEKKADDLQERKKTIQENSLSGRDQLGSLGYIGANLFKYGSPIAAAIGFWGAWPYRAAVLGAQGLTRFASTATEARLQNLEVDKERQRINDENEAWDLANNIHNEAEHFAGNDTPSKEALDKGFLSMIPTVILDRLEKNGSGQELTNFTGRVMQGFLELHLHAIEKSLLRIENNPKWNADKKASEKERVLSRQRRNLLDYDRMLSQAGTIDRAALGLKQMEKAGKLAQYAMMVGAADKLLHGSFVSLWQNLGGLFQDSDQVIESISESAVQPEVTPQPRIPEQPLTPEQPATPTPAETVSIGPTLEQAGRVAEAPSNIPEQNIGIVDAGGNAWKAAESLVDKGVITQEEFSKAWSNPASVVELPDGRQVHISELGVTNAGDKFAYIPAEGDAPAKFAFVGDTSRVGTNEDLARAFDSAGKPRPEWLQDVAGGRPELRETIEEIRANYSDTQGLEWRDKVMQGQNVLGRAEFIDSHNVDAAMQELAEKIPGGGAAAIFKHDLFGNISGVELYELRAYPVSPAEMSLWYSDPLFRKAKVPERFLNRSPESVLAPITQELALLRRLYNQLKLSNLLNTPEGGFVSQEMHRITRSINQEFGQVYKSTLPLP